jgi:hypothetical protein
MTTNAQYSALTRLLTHNNRVHQLEDLLLQMPAPIGKAGKAKVAADWNESRAFRVELDSGIESNPIADLQDDIDKEVRASLVACWFAMPREFDDLEEA